MRKPNTVVTGAVAISAAAAVAFTGASFAFAGSGGETAPSEPSGSRQPLSSVSVVGGNRYGSSGAASGPAAAGEPGRHAHTEVVGEALAQVTAVVKAKDAGITVRRVLQDPDGLYHAVGTRADGTRVMVQVSKDQKSVEVRTGGPGMGKLTGALSGTTVTGDALRKIAAAVKARDARVTLRAALKLTDGTYWAIGSRADGTLVVGSLNAKLEVTNLQTRPIGGQWGMRGDGNGDSGTRNTAPSTTPAAV